MPRLTTDEQIDLLGLTISQARRHFQVWEALEEAKAEPAKVRAMNLYLEFFDSNSKALFVSCIAACYCLFEGNKKAVSFRSLKDSLNSFDNRDIEQEPELADLQAKMKTLWTKISRLRNEAFGHVSNNATPREVFAKAKVSPQDIQDFLDLAVKLHHGITYPRTQSFDAFNLDGKPATRRLLDQLSKSL
jgi:hypothetical protein